MTSVMALRVELACVNTIVFWRRSALRGFVDRSRLRLRLKTGVEAAEEASALQLSGMLCGGEISLARVALARGSPPR